MKRAKSSHFFIHLDTATPSHRSARLGGPEPRNFALSGPHRHSSAPPRRSIALPRRTWESCFGSSLPLILTIIHWINEDPNK